MKVGNSQLAVGCEERWQMATAKEEREEAWRVREMAKGDGQGRVREAWRVRTWPRAMAPSWPDCPEASEPPIARKSDRERELVKDDGTELARLSGGIRAPKCPDVR